MYNPTTAMFSSVFLAVCVYLCFYCFREYRIDRLRQHLFELRDELFDLAAAGEIEFNHPAYTATRTMLNSVIRFAHRITVVRFTLALVWRENPPISPRFLIAFAELPAGEIKNKIAGIQIRVAGYIIHYLFTGCPVLILFLFAFGIDRLLRGAVKKISDIFWEFAKQAPGIRQIEALAIEAES